MDVKAHQKYLVTSPRKLREVVYMIKSLTPVAAVERLPYVEKKAGNTLLKVIQTALANARVQNINVSDLIFKEIQVTEGPRLKRWKAGARGRVKPYKRRMSHIRVVLTTTKKQSDAPSKTNAKDADQKPEKEVKKGPSEVIAK